MRPSASTVAVSLALCGAAITHAFTVGGGPLLAGGGALARAKGAMPSARASRRRRGVASMYFFGQDMSEIELFSRQLEGVVVPLFDPLDDPIPVPFPYEGADMISYKFDQPAYLQMAGDAIEKGFFGHIVSKPEADTLVGAVGCICTVNRDMSEERTGALAVAAGVRFEIVEVVNSIPYASALVKVLHDEPYPSGSAPSDRARLNKAMDLEGETFRSLLDIIRLSAEMESRGAGGNNNLCPTSTLDTARARLDTYREKALEMSNLHERHQYLGYLVTELLDMSHEETVKCFTTTDSAQRLETLVDQLKAIKEELAALSALDKLGAGSPASAAGDESEGGTKVVGIVPASDMLAVGMRIEYWWDEKEGWCTAKLMSKQELMGEVLTWTVQFDMDNEKCELKLNNENKARWRILRAGEGR